MSLALSNRSADHDFIDVTDPIQMDVDLDALRANYCQLERVLEPGTKIMASIKGNGYGVGAAPVAAVLRNAGVYAVATGGISDALAIRHAGNNVPIHMFPGILPEALGVLHANDLMPTIYNQQLAEAASNVARSPWKVFVKVDAGGGRLGVPLAQAESFVLELARQRNIEIEGIFTHLPFAGDAALEWVNTRLQMFDDLVDQIRRKGLEIPVRQSLASAGVIKGLKTKSNTVCVGHLLFGGLGRFAKDDAMAAQFRPVHNAIRTRIIDTRHYARDERVGSSGKLSVQAGSKFGTVPLGLHEGYRAGVPGQRPFMLIDGIGAPVVSVTQEYSVLDLSEHPHADIGDEVIALGSSGHACVTIEEMATWQGRSPLEVAMSMDRALPKHYLSTP